jgi:heme-degrading monooxygenase HmoA
VHARTTIVQGSPAQLEEGIAQVRDQVMPSVTAMDGCVGISMLCDRSTGRCIVTTAWESEDAMSASAQSVVPLREEATRTLDAGTSDVMTWEIAAVHRDHWVPEGACARVTWLSGPPETADRAVDMFRMVVLPMVQELDGFCAASFMVNREAGKAAGVVVFDSRESLEASRDATTQLRERTTQEMSATVDAVEEMEVAFAHLHVPEMA